MSDENRSARTQLILLYGAKCMATMLQTDLTYHHIEKAEWGGKATIENGVVLTSKFHCWLTDLECKDPELYDLVNECFVLYKMCLDRGLTELVDMYMDECVPEFQKKLIKRR